MNRLPFPSVSRAWPLAALLLFASPAFAAQRDAVAWAREAIRGGQYKEGLERIEKILADESAPDSDKREARMLRVHGLMETGRYGDALKEAKALADRYDSAQDVQILFAEALIETGGYSAAVKRVRSLQQRKPKHARTRVLAYELARLIGDTPWAGKQVDFFFDFYNEADPDKLTAEAITAVARAIEQENPKHAWRAYQEAQRADGDYIESYIHGGFLCIDKYHWGFAKEQFESVLKRNPNHAVAHAGLGAVYLSKSKYDEAQKSIEKALKVNPNLSLALELKATLLAMDHKQDESLELIKKILAVNPNSIPGLSLLAAYHEAHDEADKRDETIARVHKIDKRNVEVYITLARAAERVRQFPAAVQWARKAIGLNRDHWNGHYIAGMNLLRTGEEAEGYRILETAWELNDFNVWARNMLTVLDKDVKRKRFVYHRTKHFFVKLEQSEDEILWPYLELALEQAYDKFAAKYKIHPVGPVQYGGRILFLMFPKHEDFSARTIGLPGLGALGACFGQVITMPSPRFGKQRPNGLFNWKRVLEHEFVHVLTLQRTHYRIPRWFTEGISTWEEQDPQIQWDRLLIAALDRGQLLPLEDINVGFTRPKFPQQVVLSYYHASLICAYLEKTYGFETIDRMLSLYGEGKQTEQVLPAVTGKDMKTLNEEVLAFVREYASKIKMSAPVGPNELAKVKEQLLEDPKNPKLLVRLASGQLSARQVHAARDSAIRAIASDPKTARAYGILGYIEYEINKDYVKARERFKEAKEADPNYFFGRLFLGVLARKSGSLDEAVVELEAARKLYPRYASGENNPHFLLADIYEQQKKPARAIDVLKDWVGVDNTSFKGWRRLARLLVKQERHAEAAAAYLEAIYINPFELDDHIAAGKAYEKAGAFNEAVREYGVATKIESTHMEALVGRARALAATDRKTEARDALADLLAVDPDYIVTRIRRARARTEAGRKALAEVLAVDPHNAEAAKLRK